MTPTEEAILKVLRQPVTLTFPNDLKEFESRIRLAGDPNTLDFMLSEEGKLHSPQYKSYTSAGANFLFYNILGLLVEEFALVQLTENKWLTLSMDSDEELSKRDYPFDHLRSLVASPFLRPKKAVSKVEDEGLMGGMVVAGCSKEYIKKTWSTSTNFYEVKKKKLPKNRVEDLRLKNARKLFRKAIKTDEAVIVNNEGVFVSSASTLDLTRYGVRSKNKFKEDLGLRTRKKEVDNFLYKLMFIRGGYDHKLEGTRKKCVIGCPYDTIAVSHTSHIVSHVMAGTLQKKGFVTKVGIKEEPKLIQYLDEAGYLLKEGQDKYVVAVLDYAFDSWAAKELAHGSRNLDEAKDLMTISGSHIVHPLSLMYEKVNIRPFKTEKAAEKPAEKTVEQKPSEQK